MKRSDLNVDEAYYHDPSPKWRDGSGYRAVGKAVLVDAGWWKQGGRWNDYAPEAVREGAGGAGVLADVTAPSFRGETTTRQVVSPAHLRGPYEATLAEVTEAKEAARAAAQAKADAADLLNARQRAARDRAQAVGVRAWPYRGADMLVNVADLERLLDAYEAAANIAKEA